MARLRNEEAFQERHDGTYYYFAPWRTRQGTPTSAKTEVPWCTREPQRYDGSDAGHADLTHRFNKVRCPTCGRRLQLLTIDIENGYGDFWPYIPPHKVRITQVRKKTPKAKSRGFGGPRRGR